MNLKSVGIIHPEGTCSRVECHAIGPPDTILIVFLELLSSLVASSMHFKASYWTFCKTGLHSTMWMLIAFLKFENFEDPCKKMLKFIFLDGKKELYQLKEKDTFLHGEDQPWGFLVQVPAQQDSHFQVDPSAPTGT